MSLPSNRGENGLAETRWTAGAKLVGSPQNLAIKEDKVRPVVRRPHFSIGFEAEVRRRTLRLRRQLRVCKQAHNDLLLELRLAESVQRSMLPRVLPSPPGVEFGAALRPVQHMAGDFYNIQRLDQDRVCCYLGDVVGHGPAAALLSVFVMQSIRPKRIEGSRYEIVPPAEVMEQLNREVIAARFPNEPFLTMVYGVLDTRRKTWTYCSCGHPPALIIAHEEPLRMLEVTAPLLGVFEIPFQQAEVELKADDRLVLYSDGGIAANWGPERAGLDGLVGHIGARTERSPQKAVDAAMASVAFTEQPADDVALLVAYLKDSSAPHGPSA